MTAFSSWLAAESNTPKMLGAGNVVERGYPSHHPSVRLLVIQERITAFLLRMQMVGLWLGAGERDHGYCAGAKDKRETGEGAWYQD